MNEEKIYNAKYSVGGRFKNSIDISLRDFDCAVNLLREKYEKNPLRLPIRQTFDCSDEVEAHLYRDIGETKNIQLQKFCFGNNIIHAWSDDKDGLRNLVVDELKLPEPNFD